MSEKASGRSGILESVAIVLAVAVASLAMAQAQPGLQGCTTTAISPDAAPAKSNSDADATDMCRMTIPGEGPLMLSAGIIAWIGAVFLAAGFVKGVVGMGLPTVAMGLLAMTMPPAQAAALLLIPSLVTNLWQLFTGPSFGGLCKRLWRMMAGIMIGTVAGAGLLTGAHTAIASAGLGAALVLYAILGLPSRASPRRRATRLEHRRWSAWRPGWSPAPPASSSFRRCPICNRCGWTRKT